MFTGIVESVGHVAAVEQRGTDARLSIAAPAMDLSGVRAGDSIAVSGVCLTVTDLDPGAFWVDVSAATLSCTTLGGFRAGTLVNLEQAVTPATRLGGHLVSGHVDGVGVVDVWEAVGGSYRLVIELPEQMAKYVAPKGSICVDGVSLTVNTVSSAGFEVNIIPHTREATTFKTLTPGRAVNIEVDLVARYVERLLTASAAHPPVFSSVQNAP